MKHVKSFRLFEKQNSLTPDQIGFLNKEFGDKWKLTPSTGLVDVDMYYKKTPDDEVDYEVKLKSPRMGIKYGVFNGNFVYSNEDASLEFSGLPKEVTGDFLLHTYADIDSLKGLPEEVGGDLSIASSSYVVSGTEDSKIGSLEGLPKKIGGNLEVGYTNLNSLKGYHTNIGGKVFILIKHNKPPMGGKAEFFNAWYWIYIMLKKYEIEGNYRVGNKKWTPEVVKKVEELFSTLYTLDDFKKESEKNPQDNIFLKDLKSDDSKKLFNTFIMKVVTQMNDKEIASFEPFIDSKIEILNSEIQKDPEGMIMKLKGIWNSEGFYNIRKRIKFPDRYEKEMDTLGDLTDLGF